MTDSSGWMVPSWTIFSRAASVAPPSGQVSIPSFSVNRVAAASRSASETATALPPVSRFITNDELRDFTFGVGLHVETLFFDYAYLPFEGGFEGPGHVLTLTYVW